MKPLTQLGIGVCGGALAALLYHATYSASSFAPPAFAPPDPASESIARESVQALSGEVPTGSSAATSDAARARAGDAAFLDPTGFFEAAERAGSIDALVAGLEVLITVDPARVVDIVAKFTSRGSAEVDALYLRAISALANRDPQTAIARLQGAANGPRRNPILSAIAAGYARLDPDAALLWANSVVPASPDAVASVLTTVAARDLLRAHDMLPRAQYRVGDVGFIGSRMAQAALSSGQAPGPLASALAPSRSPAANAILSALLSGWMGREPERTVAWMAENEGYLTNELTRAAVYDLAFANVELAASLIDRVPPSAQDQWLSEVAARYGQMDFEKALAWLPQYRDRANYRELVNQMLVIRSRLSSSVSEMEAVARFIATAKDDVDQNIVSLTGHTYGTIDPQTAAGWALSLTEPQRTWALSGVADGWASKDGQAAQHWALTQPPGPLRDAILGVLLTDSVFYGELDQRALVEGFTSLEAAQQGIYTFIVGSVGNRRETTAASRALIEWMLARLTDPELRRQAEERIAAAAQ